MGAAFALRETVATTARGVMGAEGVGSNSAGRVRFLPADEGATGAAAGARGAGATSLTATRSRWSDSILTLRRSI